VGFEAMLVVAMMRACRTCPEVFQPFVDLVGEAAQVILGLDEATAPTLCLRDHLYAMPAARPAGLDSIAVTLAAGIPGSEGPRLPERRYVFAPTSRCQSAAELPSSCYIVATPM
jgi:hypothetical protein